MLNKIALFFKRHRWIKKTLLGFFIFGSVLIALLTSVVSTDIGSRWFVQKSAALAQVQLGNMRGNLLTGLDVDSLNYERNQLSIHAEKISFRWQPIALFYTTVSVQSLAADNIIIKLPPANNEPEPAVYEWPSFAQPLRVELTKLQLQRVQIQQQEQTLDFSRINGSLSLGTFHFRLKNLELISEQGSAKLNGSVGLRYPYSLSVKGNWQYDIGAQSSAEKTHFAGQFESSGDIKLLNIQQALTQPQQLNIQTELSPALHDRLHKSAANIHITWPEQPLAEFTQQYVQQYIPIKPLNAAQGQLQIRGWLDQFSVTGDVQAKTAERQVTLSTILAGQIDSSKKNAKITLEQLRLHNAATEENILVKGQIHFLPALQWQLDLQAQQVNLNDYVDTYPSNLNVTLTTHGQCVEKKCSLDIDDINGAGELRDLAVSAQGQLHFDGERWSTNNANVAIGANQLMLKGHAGKQLDLAWKINAPLLNQIDASMSGSVISEGVLSGDMIKPHVQMSARINQWVWRDYAIENLSLQLTPNASDNYELALDADHIQAQQQRLARLQVKGRGTLASHKLSALIESPVLGNLSAAWDGVWAELKWRGQWREFSLNAKKIPRWYLTSSAPMQASEAGVSVGKLCLTTAVSTQTEKESVAALAPLPHTNVLNNLVQKLTGKSAQVSEVVAEEMPLFCVAGNLSKDKGIEANATLSGVPLRDAQAWFKSDVNLHGVIDGQASLRSLPNKALAAEAHLQTRNAQFLYQFQGGNTEIYPLKKSVLDIAVKNNLLSAALAMDWEKYGTIEAETKLNLQDKKLQGKAIVALTDLAPLESLLPFLNNVKGSAQANVNLGGVWEKPEIQGNFLLANGGANLPKLGLTLSDVRLQMTSLARNQIQVDGQITSGDGTLMLKGSLDNLGAESWAMSGNIFGANIRIIEQPQIIASVSPNLTFTASHQAIHLMGSSEIPWARANLKTLPTSATRVSNDVTVIESKTLLPTKTSGASSIPFYTDVLLYFGDDVRFKGFGLDSQLSGKIKVFKEENRQTFTTGFVSVGKGNYKAYGQDLSIERGRLVFQGPYDDPGLDIRAYRTIDNSVAGLEIAGTLQRPKSKVFSIPAASDSEAMAMLLTGKALSQSSKEDAYSLIGAISSLGMDSGQMMTADIAKRFRIDEITIKSDKGLDQSELWVGKYVTPKLFIRYMVGLFDQAFSLGMRYQLNEKLRVEAESGKTQSVDVIYKIER